MQQVSFKLTMQQIKDNREREYRITIQKPQGIRLTIANTYQIFWRYVKQPRSWKKHINWNFHEESPNDTEKLDKIKVISIEEIITKEQEVFKKIF